MQASHIVDAFVQQLTSWLAGNSQRPDTQAIPGSWLEHWIYESPHEFYSEPGWANPIDVSKPFETHMNLDFLMPLINDYPYQELVSFVELGVRYKADLEPLILLQPHLVSFLPVQDKFLKEADKSVHSCLPVSKFVHYARLNPDTYSSLLDRAERSCVASVQTSNLPLTEQFDLFLSLQQISDAL